VLELKAAMPAAGQFHVKVERHGEKEAIASRAAAGLFVRPLMI